MFKSRYILVGALLAASTFSIGTAYAADGCGPYGWRGRWGHCHFVHAYVYGAPVVVADPPQVIYTGPVAAVPGCSQGYWLGPWGHCRDTPYHGRLPNGLYQ